MAGAQRGTCGALSVLRRSVVWSGPEGMVPGGTARGQHHTVAGDSSGSGHYESEAIMHLPSCATRGWGRGGTGHQKKSGQNGKINCHVVVSAKDDNCPFPVPLP